MKIREEDCKKLFGLLGATFFYGDFVAETYNEREIEKILRKYDYFFETEDELMKKLHVDINVNLPPRPEPPLSRLIIERDMYSKCSECGSSMHRRFVFIVSKHCIQPECKNYYGRHQNDKKEKR
jgi:hypothetical protein